MTVADNNLAALIAALTPAERRIVEESLREGARMPDEARAILRWLRRRLKRRVRAGKR